MSRAISSLVHMELSTLDIPNVLNLIDHQTWISPARQDLLFQPIAQAEGIWHVKFDETTLSGGADVADPYGWTSRLAQQSLQQDFSSGLSVLFDGQSLGHVFHGEVPSGSRLDLSHGQSSGEAVRAPLTAAYGFIDFDFGHSLPQNNGRPSSMQVARPVAIAITAGNQNNQEAIVRGRQVGVNNLSLQFYRVDDLTGMINGVAPGDKAYEKEVLSRLYQTVNGETAISGGGYGIYSEDRLQGVDNGDLIAMSLKTSQGNTFYSFSNANEYFDGRYVAHVRSFGLNTWGWEDLFGGGDLDFNDLVVGLDFTSSAGYAILA